ncbi:hypothetical protein MTBBW1_1370002 [Desulfamplus magnetovallimortis]|uniref:Uncharacterized protein n=1 Tax=Desulfamplus magnetovallimortis TaxID=1246637 RepID=A0A1W1H7J1_9BACT|nr:hypothetical protein MTBBW1_1370002 [Desulfamplus magnetovallimortis]
MLFTNSMTKQANIQNHPATQHMCEFLSHPFDDCYCSRLSGLNIPYVVNYCMERYWECSLYKKLAKQKERLISASSCF